MSELALREVLESRGNNFQVLDEARQIIGYIVLLTALAGTHHIALDVVDRLRLL